MSVSVSCVVDQVRSGIWGLKILIRGIRVFITFYFSRIVVGDYTDTQIRNCVLPGQRCVSVKIYADTIPIRKWPYQGKPWLTIPIRTQMAMCSV